MSSMTRPSSEGYAPPDDAECKRIFELHQDGASVHIIGKHLRRHPNTIKRVLQGAGLTPRPRRRGDRYAAARATAESVLENAEYRRSIRPAHVTAAEGTQAWLEQQNRAFTRHMLAVLREEGRVAP